MRIAVWSDVSATLWNINSSLFIQIICMQNTRFQLCVIWKRNCVCFLWRRSDCFRIRSNYVALVMYVFRPKIGWSKLSSIDVLMFPFDLNVCQLYLIIWRDGLTTSFDMLCLIDFYKRFDMCNLKKKCFFYKMTADLNFYINIKCILHIAFHVMSSFDFCFGLLLRC